MRLLEHQAKIIFNRYNIDTPKGFISNNINEIKNKTTLLEYPIILKAQVPVGGRGKAGAIQKCNNLEECIEKYTKIMNMKIKEEKVKSILIEQAIKYKQELYVSIFLNRGKRCYNIITSSEGGIEIESVKNQIINEIDIEHLDEKILKKISKKMTLSNESEKYFIELLQKLSKLVIEKEIELAEINPLVVLENNKLLALDGKIITDDNSNFRQKELQIFNNRTKIEEIAEKNGFSLIELDGNIAVIGNGAGLVMSTLDILTDSNGKAACFLDVGGSATVESVYTALELISKLNNVEGILINLYGGIVKTTTVALACLNAYKNNLINMPVCARLKGNESEKAKHMLNNTNTKIFDTIESAIKSIVTKVKKYE